MKTTWMSVKDHSDFFETWAQEVGIKDEDINGAYAKHVATIGELVATVKVQVANMVHVRAALRPLKPNETRQDVLQKAAEIVTALKVELSPCVSLLGDSSRSV